MPAARTPAATLRRVLSLAERPLTRAQLYERQRHIDDITEMDRHLARMVEAGQVRQVDDAYTLQET
jgi:hypothetical protein